MNKRQITYDNPGKRKKKVVKKVGCVGTKENTANDWAMIITHIYNS